MFERDTRRLSTRSEPLGSDRYDQAYWPAAQAVPCSSGAAAHLTRAGEVVVMSVMAPAVQRSPSPPPRTRRYGRVYWMVPHGGPLVPLAASVVIEDPEAPSISMLTHPAQLEDLMSRLYRRGHR